jgi:hypothetical protein
MAKSFVLSGVADWPFLRAFTAAIARDLPGTTAAHADAAARQPERRDSAHRMTAIERIFP